MARPILIAGLAAALAVASGAAALAQDPLTDRQRADVGRRLVQRNCSQCHAVGPTGDSPSPKAPALRNLGMDYPFFDFSEALRHGMLLRHPEMPEMRLTSTEIEALISYLREIQTLRQTSNPR